MGSSATVKPPAGSLGHPAAPPESRFDELIDDRLRKTQGYVKFVDVAESLMGMAAGALAYLLVVALIDHWLITGGLGFWGRLLAWAGLLVGLGVYAARTLLPHVLHRVNPAFAAHALERAEPSLKNSLLNLLFLRADHRGVPRVVLDGLRQQAAAGISTVPVDAAVDRSRLLKIGYVLIAILMVGALYKVFSPKDLLPSVARVMVPWAAIDPVTRVRIENVKPGDTEAITFTQLQVSAEVRGLRDDETVTLSYSSRDEQAVDVPIAMYRPEGQREHSCLLPARESGLAHDVSYRIRAGDAVTRSYQVTVVTAPTIQVTSLEYQYPAYTGLASRKVENVGDIKAIEGTQVIVRAAANHQIESAEIELEGLRDATLPIKSEGSAAYHRLLLRRKPTGEDTVPEWTAYRLRMKTPRGTTNTNPIRHRIDITRDKPPAVEILQPDSVEVEVAADAELIIEIRARDQDFRLSAVRLVARNGEQPLLDENLLVSAADGQPAEEESLRTTYRFVPAQLNLQPGNVVRYFAVALDNKTPQANRTETAEYRIVITEPEGRPQDQAGRGQQPDRPQDADADQQPGGGDADGQGKGGAGGGDQGADSDDTQESPNGGQQSGDSDGSQPSAEPQAGDQQEGGGAGDGAQSGSQDQAPADSQGGKPDDGNGPPQEQTGGQPGSPADDAGSQGAEQNREGQGGAQPQSGGRGAKDEPSGPIDNEGEAFEKALEHMRDKGLDPDNQPGSSSDEAHPGDQGSRRDPSKDPSAGEAVDSGSDRGGQDGDGPQSDGKTTDEGEAPRQGTDNQAGDAAQEKDDSQGSDQESAAGSRKSQSEGGAGAGNQGEKPPAPPEGTGRPRDKSGSPSQDANRDTEPGDSSVSPHESDSAEGEEGSRSGNGDEGGGQRSPQQGEGAEGSNTPSDSGGDPSQESGQGEASGRAGDDSATDQATGRQSDQTGDASEAAGGKPGDAKQQPAAAPSKDSSPQQDGQPTDASGQPPSTPGDSGKGQPGDQSAGQGKTGDAAAEGLPQGGSGSSPGTPDQGPRNEPGADDANIDYARKQTDLVLDYLQDQLDKGGIDPELKKKFGWTDEQFREFVRRHSRMRQEVEAGGEKGREARDELDETLRSLGLRPTRGRVRTAGPKVEKAPGLSEGSRTRPPREYQEQFDAFRKDAFDK